MNIITHLQFGDNVSGLYNRDYLVVGTAVHFVRSDDGFNPTSPARCSSLDLTVVARSDKDLFFQEWFAGGDSQSGRVVYELSEVASGGDLTRLRSIFFTDARCYSFSERYDIDGDSLRFFDLKLKLGSCVIEDVHFDNGSF